MRQACGKGLTSNLYRSVEGRNCSRERERQGYEDTPFQTTAAVKDSPKMSVRMSGAGAALEADTKSRTAKSRASDFMTRERERDGGGREERRCTRGIASCLQLPVALSCCCFYRLDRRSLAGHSHPGSLGSRVPHSRRRLHKQQPLARVTRLCGPEPGFWAAIAVSLLRPSFSCSRLSPPCVSDSRLHHPHRRG